MFKLHAARRSAFFSVSEAEDGRGVRPGVERDQVMNATEVAGFLSHEYHLLRLIAFRQNPEVPNDVEALAKALVLENPPWSEERFSVDVFFGKQWVGFFCGEEVVVGADSTVVYDGVFPIYVTYSNGLKVEWRFDSTFLNFIPQHDGELPCHFPSEPADKTTGIEISESLLRARSARIGCVVQ